MSEDPSDEILFVPGVLDEDTSNAERNITPGSGEMTDLKRERLSWAERARHRLASLFSFLRKKEGAEQRVTPEQAEKLFGRDFLGPRQFQNAWEFDPDHIPPIPFSPAMLEKAKKLGMMLVLQVSHWPDGSPMTMKSMRERMLYKDGAFLGDTYFYDRQPFFSKDVPRNGWRLFSKTMLPDSLGKNEAEQLEAVIAHLKNHIFDDIRIPDHYRQAIEDTIHKKEQFSTLMQQGGMLNETLIRDLPLNALIRPTPSEICQMVQTFHFNQSDGKRLFTDAYVRTCRPNSIGKLVVMAFNGAHTFIDGESSAYEKNGHGLLLSLEA